MKKYPPIDSKLFINNRSKFTRKLKKNSVAIFNSNDEMPRNGDMPYDFRQNSDLLYLSGIDQEQSILVICPDSPLPQYREVLFLRQTNEHIAIWEGHKYTKEEATKASGVETVLWLDEFDGVITILMNHSENVYLNLNENDRFASEVPYRELRFAEKWRTLYPNHNYERSGPIMAELRAVKDKIEIDLLQTACNITRDAFIRVAEFTEPGVTEYEIEAEITHEFLRQRATGHAYHPIVASGRNACVLHYNNNNQVCQAGDVILMDFGAEYANYSADLTRCIPVSGKFTRRQKNVYNAVLRVMRAAMDMLVPGNTIEEYHKAVGELMTEELHKLRLLKISEIRKQDPKWPAYKKYFMHGTSHFLGLDTHDIGDKYAPIKAGMVFTVEPGIYILEENLGIRLENDIVVGRKGKGYNDLMADIPLEADEIEDLMNS